MNTLILALVVAAHSDLAMGWHPPPPAPLCVGTWRGHVRPTTCDCGCNWKSGTQRLYWNVKPVVIRRFGEKTCACEVTRK